MVCAVPVAIAGMLMLSGKGRSVRKRVFITVWLLLPFVSLLGFARTIEVNKTSELKKVLDKSTSAEVIGTIEFISIRPEGYALTLTDSIAHFGQLYPKADKIIVSIDSGIVTPDIGQTIVAAGTLYPCEKATNPGQFDSELYYRTRHVDARLYADDVYLVSETSDKLTFRVRRLVYRVRCFITEGIYRVLPSQEAGTLVSMLCGDRGMLDEDVKELYREGGIAHILSISSLHITLLGMGLFRLLMLLIGNLRISASLTISVMTLYGIMTGFSVSTGRAVLMLTIMLLGKMLGRGYDLMSSVGTSAFILLLIQPNYIYDSGFRMSYTAVIGIFAASAVAGRFEIRSEIARSLLMSLAVQMFTLPVIMSTYYTINLYSVVINIFVLPLMSILLMTGFGAGILGGIGGICLGPAVFVAGPVYFVLRFYEKLCNLEKILPYSSVVTGAPEGWICVLYYLIIFAVLYIALKRIPSGSIADRKRQNRRKAKWFWGLTACGIIFIHPFRPQFYTAFLDVGQGDAIYIEADGMNIMVDAGSTSVKNVGEYRVMQFLKYRGVSQLDMIVTTHMDTDHISAFTEMFAEGYPQIETLVVSSRADSSEELILQAPENDASVRYVGAGEILAVGNTGKLQINVLAPEETAGYDDENDSSIVLELCYGDFSMLLTGDSGFGSEARYIRRLGRESYCVLKCAHHGSRYSTAEETLRYVRPKVTVISCAKHNSYGHPAPETLERLSWFDSTVFTTPECGMISVETDGKSGNFVVKRYIKQSSSDYE